MCIANTNAGCRQGQWIVDSLIMLSTEVKTGCREDAWQVARESLTPGSAAVVARYSVNLGSDVRERAVDWAGGVYLGDCLRAGQGLAGGELVDRGGGNRGAARRAQPVPLVIELQQDLCHRGAGELSVGDGRRPARSPASARIAR
jgi:hypothetical protein